MNSSSSNSPSSSSHQVNHSVVGQEWCIHAQLTISHPQVQPPRNTSTTAAAENKNVPIINGNTSSISDKNVNQVGKQIKPGSNVHFQYSWTTTSDTGTKITQIVPETAGIQKFESWPRSSNSSGILSSQVQHDSGYNTESKNTSTLPTTTVSKGVRPIKPYERRCRSTCTIILSNNIDDTAQITSSTTSYAARSSSLERQPIVFDNNTKTNKSIQQKDAGTQTLNRVISTDLGSHNYDSPVGNTYLTPRPQGSNSNNNSIGRGNYVDRRKRPVFQRKSPEHATPQEHSSRSLTRRSSGSARAKSSPPVRSSYQK